MRLCEEHRLGGTSTSNPHECIGCAFDRMREALEWYADYGQGAAKEPQPLPSQGVALGMLHHDGGRRALAALGR